MSRKVIIFLLILLPVYPLCGADTTRTSRVVHDITAALSAGYNLPSHGYYRGYNPESRPIYANSSLHLEYAFGFSRKTRFGKLYPHVRQGAGLSVCTFYDHSLMGTPFLAYIFQQARLLPLSKNLNLDYKWDLGASFGWKRTELIATRANIYINVGLLLSWDISPAWTFSVGPEFTHCSNGDTRYPNGGANLINIRAGVTCHMGQDPAEDDRNFIKAYESELRERSFAQRMEYDLILFGGWRAGKVNDETFALINRPFPFFGLNFMPMYRLSRNFSIGASLDLLADRSADLYDVVKDIQTGQVLSWRQPPLHEQMAAGLSLRADITMPIFTVGAGVGGFVAGTSDALQGIYSIFSLKAFVTDRLFLNVSYRLSTKNFTHNMMYGLGWRFN